MCFDGRVGFLSCDKMPETVKRGKVSLVHSFRGFGPRLAPLAPQARQKSRQLEPVLEEAAHLMGPGSKDRGRGWDKILSQRHTPRIL
jgi:hypothetical protein